MTILKFFDNSTGTLFITKGKTPVENLSENPLQELRPLTVSFPPSLRKQTASNYKIYVSTQTGEECMGGFDLSHPSNGDLEEVATVIHCP